MSANLVPAVDTLLLLPSAGKSSVAIAVAPKQIKYGFITVRSERWKTLRAMMLLDIAYLDEDIRYVAHPPICMPFLNTIWNGNSPSVRLLEVQCSTDQVCESREPQSRTLVKDFKSHVFPDLWRG